MKKGITPREQDYSEWYLDIIQAAQLADYSPVKGCMVIKPYGFALWENMQRDLDDRFKETDVENAYFPLFIPKSFLCREAEHVEGFAKECAIVTHTRLKDFGGGDLRPDPDSQLEEELIVRPTSETIINSMFAKWIQSHRDLPMLINQWCNVVRWEMRTRLFLRTTEFLWQEGHTCHASAEEAVERTQLMLEVYADFASESLAVPVIKGLKTENEKFAGAEDTYTIEAMMQDGKALQSGTSHFLGQNFSKVFGSQFQGKDGKVDNVWQTSWGVSTRLIGALIMSHSDDKGLVVPPNVAPTQVVLIPITRKKQDNSEILEKMAVLKKELKSKGIRVKLDDRDSVSPGWKFNEWEKKGVPLRVELGGRDLDSGHFIAKDRVESQANNIPFETAADWIQKKLVEIQDLLLRNAQSRLVDNTVTVDSWDGMTNALSEGKFAKALWSGLDSAEEKLKNDCQGTVRCLALTESYSLEPIPEGIKAIDGEEAKAWAILAKAY